jgi:predicted nucleic acid-binding protein
VKALVPEEGSAQAMDLLREAVSSGSRLIAPAFAWAEVGTVLVKKMKAGLITDTEATIAWDRFVSLSIDYLQDASVLQAAWDISLRYQFPTMYDASFLAVCDRVAEESRGSLEFWTADIQLVRDLGSSPPPYMKLLKGVEVRGIR